MQYIYFLAFIAAICYHIPLVAPIKCHIAVGQRGKLYENGITWERNCPDTKYCIEVITTDITVVQKLFDYPFDSYYNEFYARTCGGDLGTPADYHPYRGCDKCRDPHLGLVQLNVTTPIVITGHGGTEMMTVKYICRYDLCWENGASSLKASYMLVVSVIAIAAGALLAF
jgi:hypothetical protein